MSSTVKTILWAAGGLAVVGVGVAVWMFTSGRAGAPAAKANGALPAPPRPLPSPPAQPVGGLSADVGNFSRAAVNLGDLALSIGDALSSGGDDSSVPDFPLFN